MKLTYYGHSCFLVEVNSQALLFDPFISPNALAQQAGVKHETIKADIICVSHGHADHIADCVSLAKANDSLVISNFEIVNWLAAQGLHNCQPMNLGGSCKVGPISFYSTIAHHSSSLPDGSYGGNPGGFVVESSQGNFYYAGDTALTLEMQLIGQRQKLDWAVLPIGDIFTMGVTDAIKAAKMLGVSKVVGVHYQTFAPICIDTDAAVAAFAAAGIELLLPAIGSTIQL